MKVDFAHTCNISPSDFGRIESVLSGIAIGNGPGRWPALPTRIEVRRILSGGKSGAQVLDIVAHWNNRRQSKVLKIGPYYDLHNEFNAYMTHLKSANRMFVPIEAVSESLLHHHSPSTSHNAVIYCNAADHQIGTALHSFEEIANSAISDTARLNQVLRILDQLIDGVHGTLYGDWREQPKPTTLRNAWNNRLGIDAVVHVTEIDPASRAIRIAAHPKRQLRTLYPRDLAYYAISTEPADDLFLAPTKAKLEWWQEHLIATFSDGDYSLMVRVEASSDTPIHLLPGRDAIHSDSEWYISGTITHLRSQAAAHNLSKLLGDEYQLSLGILKGPGTTIPDPFTDLPQVLDTERASRVTSVVHGDLNPRNILIVDGNPCLIDYAFTRAGEPLLSDFVRLEGCLLRDVIPKDISFAQLASLQRYLSLMCRLATRDTTDVDIAKAETFFTSRLSADRQDLGRVFRLLWAIRSAARRAVPLHVREWWAIDYMEQLYLFGHVMMKWNGALAAGESVSRWCAMTAAALCGVAAETFHDTKIYHHWPLKELRAIAEHILRFMLPYPSHFLRDLASFAIRFKQMKLRTPDKRWNAFRAVRKALVRDLFQEEARMIKVRLEADHDVFVNLRAYIDLKGQLKAASQIEAPVESGIPIEEDDDIFAEQERLRFDDSQPRDDVMTLLSEHEALVLIGDAGAGKSTVSREWEYRLANAILTGSSDLEPRVPIVIRASAAAKALNRHGHTVANLNDEDLILPLEGFLNTHPLPNAYEKLYLQCTIGASAVVVDAMNELDDHNKSAVARWITEFRRKFTLCPLLVCHRQYNYPPRLLPFPVVTLQKVSTEQTRTYIQSYLRERITDVNATGVSADELAQRLIKLLLDHPDHEQVRDLARTPLFLWMIVERFRQSRELPSNRARLFDSFSQWYLGERHHLEYDEPIAMNAPYQDKVVFLGRLGCAMNEERTTEMSLDRMSAFIDVESAVYSEIVDAEMLQIEGDKARFLHQSFQEYFAARYILPELEKNQAEITRRVTDFGWHDSLLLLLGFGGEHIDVVSRLVQTALRVNARLTARCLRMAELEEELLLRLFVDAQSAVLASSSAGVWSYKLAASALAEYGRGKARQGLWRIVTDQTSPELARCVCIGQLAELPAQVRFESIAAKLRTEFVTEVPRIIDANATISVQVASIEAIARLNLFELQSYLIDFLFSDEWILCRAARNACNRLKLSLTPRQQAAYQAACKRRLRQLEEELYAEARLERIHALTDERMEIVEALATSDNVLVLLRRRFAFVVDRNNAWDDRIGEWIDRAAVEVMGGPILTNSMKLSTGAEKKQACVLADALSILRSKGNGWNVATLLRLVVEHKEELTTLAAGHVLVKAATRLSVDGLMWLIAEVGEKLADDVRERAQESALCKEGTIPGDGSRSEEWLRRAYWLMSVVAKIVVAGAFSQHRVIVALQSLLTKLMTTEVNIPADAVANTLYAINQISPSDGPKTALIVSYVLSNQRWDQTLPNRFPLVLTEYYATVRSAIGLLQGDGLSVRAGLYRLQAEGGAVLFVGGKSEVSLDADSPVFMRMAALGMSEIDPRGQFQLVRAAAAVRAVNILPGILQLSDERRMFELVVENWSPDFGRIEERMIADVYRAIGYLAREVLDRVGKTPAAADAARELQSRLADWSKTKRIVDADADAEDASTINRSILVGLITGLAYLGEWKPILKNLRAGERWVHIAALNAFEFWVPGPLAARPSEEYQEAAIWITRHLEKDDLAPEVRSTLYEIKARLERKLGHHTWLDDWRDPV